MYTIQWFKEKFGRTKEENWTTLHLGYGNTHCALGHCEVERNAVMGDYRMTEESLALINIFKGVFAGKITSQDFQYVTLVNDNIPYIFGFQPDELGITPKERIMKVLEMAEELENEQLIAANLEYIKEELTAELV